MKEHIMLKKLLLMAMLVSLIGLEALADGNKVSNRDKKCTTKKNVLILYDNVGPYANTGKSYSMMLENLLGHFKVNVITKPTSSYVAGDMKKNIAVFYIGNTYGVLDYYPEGSSGYKAYQALYKDAATGSVPLVWMNYNFEYFEQAWNRNNWGAGSMTDNLGIRFDDILPIQYNRIKYKNTELYKGVVPFATPGSTMPGCLSEGNNRYACALELVRIAVIDANKTKVYATAYSSLDSTVQEMPYITKARNIWFIGDIPFTYISEEDRYLAFSDLLHDMVGISHKEKHLALMRLEDIDAKTNMSDLTAIAELAKSKDVFFSVATIAQYEDPFGVENNGVATSINLTDSEIGTYLKELYDQKRIAIIAHGYTHQAGNIKNPYDGLSGNDFEFMRVVENSDHSYSYLYPTWNDSGFYAWLRMHSAKKTFRYLGMKAFAWEAPHYMAGPNQYRAIQKLFPVQYARILYYPSEESADQTKKYKFFGQFYPYVIRKDIYGYTVIPENIHNVVVAPNEGYRQISAEDIVRFAKKLKVVRDGVASFYYHAFLGTSQLSKIIDGLRQEGYTFVKAPALAKKYRRHRRKRSK